MGNASKSKITSHLFIFLISESIPGNCLAFSADGNNAISSIGGGGFSFGAVFLLIICVIVLSLIVSIWKYLKEKGLSNLALCILGLWFLYDLYQGFQVKGWNYGGIRFVVVTAGYIALFSVIGFFLKDEEDD